jgi:hypothetical protein
MKKFDFSQGVPVGTPDIRQKKSTLGKVGDFLAPSTTKTIRGMKAGETPSFRDLAGSALEIGSFAIPGGAIIKGGKAAAKGVKLASAARKAPLTELEKTTSALKSIGTQGKTAVKEGALVGGVSGSMWGTGAALADEDKSIPQAIGEGAIAGGLGATVGAVGVPLFKGASAITSKLAKAPSEAFSKAKSMLNPTDRATVVEDLTQAVRKGMVADKPDTLNKFEDILNTSARREGREFTEDSLIREVFHKGFFPEIDGQLFRFRGELFKASDRIANLAKGMDTLAKKSTEKTKLSTLLESARKELTGRIDVDMMKASSQLKQIGKLLRSEFGEEISAENVVSVLRKMNQATKSFDKDKFILDTAQAIAHATRTRLKEIVPGSGELNKKMAQLFRIKETMNVLNNQKFEVGFFDQAIGRFLGVSVGGAAGLSVAGPGGLVVAGVMANMGSKGLANLIRQARFNPNAMRMIKSGVQSDKKLVEKIMKEASDADKALIERIMKTPQLPAPKERMITPNTQGTPNIKGGTYSPGGDAGRVGGMGQRLGAFD